MKCCCKNIIASNTSSLYINQHSNRRSLEWRIATPIKMNYFRINRELIPAKIASFLSAAYLGSFVGFLNVFFVSVGMSEVQAGILTAIMYTSCILTGPMWGYLADYTRRRTFILVVLCTGAAVSISSLPWTAYGLNNMMDDQTIRNNSKLCLTFQNKSDCKDKVKNILFYVLLCTMVIASAFVLPLMTYFEAIVANVAKLHDASFGAQRTFGEIGISFSSMLTGFICDHFKVKGLSEFFPAFLVFPTICVAMLPIGHHLIRQEAKHRSQNFPDEQKKNTETMQDKCQNVHPLKDSENQTHEYEMHAIKIREMDPQEVSQKQCCTLETSESCKSSGMEQSPMKQERSLLRKTLDLCSTPSVIMFLITVFISGVANAIYLSFTLKFLVNEMRRTKFEGSIAFAVQPITSCTSFIFADEFVKMFGGTIPTMAVALFVVFIRLLVLSFNIPYGVFIGVCLLNGFSFATFYAAMIEHILSISPKEITMTMNHITLGLFFYVGSLVANIGGSKVYEEYGGRKLFFGQSIICGVWAVVLLLYFAKTNMNRNREQITSKHS